MTNALSRFDELNLSRLNLISALDQAEETEWDVNFEAEGRIVRVRCEALPKYAVPHGLDSDVSSALLNLYIESGEPEDGRFAVSATTLLKLCGWHNTGKYHGLLRTSLERLHTSSFSVSGGWRDHPKGRWTHAKFHFIESLDFSSADGAGAFDERTIITGRLADAIVASIRGGYVKPLDTVFMLSLSRPRTRALYRILDGARYNPANPDEPLNVLDVNLIAWADQCKIPSSVPGNIRRSLQAPHTELIERGYLKSVDVSGRGRQQMIRYEFVPEFMPMDPQVAARLASYGIADGTVRKLMKQHDRTFLTDSMNRFDTLVKNGVVVVKKTKAAALMHLLTHPDDYPYPAVNVNPAEAVVKASRMEPMLEAPSIISEFTGLYPEQAAEKAVRRLNLFYRNRIPTTVLDGVRQAILDEQLDVVALMEDAMRAVTQDQRDEFARELRWRVEGKPAD